MEVNWIQTIQLIYPFSVLLILCTVARSLRAQVTLILYRQTSITLQSMTLDQGMKLMYPEDTPTAQEEHAYWTGIKPLILEVKGMLTIQPNTKNTTCRLHDWQELKSQHKVWPDLSDVGGPCHFSIFQGFLFLSKSLIKAAKIREELGLSDSSQWSDFSFGAFSIHDSLSAHVDGPTCIP